MCKENSTKRSNLLDRVELSYLKAIIKQIESLENVVEVKLRLLNEI